MAIDEDSYLEGQRAAWRQLLSTCIRELGDGAPDGSRAVLQLHDARVAVRQLVADVGGDSPDDLHLADVVEKRLRPIIDRLLAERDRLRESVRRGAETGPAPLDLDRIRRLAVADPVTIDGSVTKIASVAWDPETRRLVVEVV